MKTMCPPSYHHNSFVATHALGQMMYGYTLLVPKTKESSKKSSATKGCSTTHLYYTLCLACSALFGSLVPAMCKFTSSAQVHEFSISI